MVFVQYRLLITGLALQKTNLDKKAESWLRDVKSELHNPGLTASEIAVLTKPGYIADSPERDTLQARMLRGLEKILQEKAEERDLAGIDFAFALTAGGVRGFTISSQDFDEEHSRFSRYFLPLSGAVAEGCQCQIVLRLNVQNIFNYLLRQLQNLLIPSLFFLLLLVGCFAWLLHLNNRQRRLAEVKNDFINNLTHELKTPVFSVSLASKMLEEHLKSLPAAKPKEYVRLIRNENEKMKTHIDRVLELAGLESGRYIFDKTEVKVENLLQEAADSLRVKIKPGGEISYDFQTENTVRYLDKNHFYNVIVNLLENAIKYCDKDFPKIEIKTETVGSKFLIKITDNGKGIPAAAQKQIFEKFFRVTDGDLHEVKGFGLGLSYVRQVVEKHGGSISVESEIGKGSTFIITFKKSKK